MILSDAVYFWSSEPRAQVFGLMKTRMCHLEGEAKLRRRLHYCGACKTIGRMYGQKSRFLLNHDTVFLAELLSALSGDYEKVREWASPYQSYSCLSLPHSEAQMPLSLKVAATATLVLAEFKIIDHVSDSGQRRWKLASRLYSKPFRDASRCLESWGFPVDQLRDSLGSQTDRERRVATGFFRGSTDDKLRYLAEPTAQATALFFQQGARLSGLEDLSGQTWKIGYDFGALIYLLDALEDYEKDFLGGEFNAVRAAYGFVDSRLSAAERRTVNERLWMIAENITFGLFRLPIDREHATQFASRLESNLASKLAVKLAVAQSAPCACSLRRSTGPSGLRARIRSAISIGKSITKRHMASCQGPVANLAALAASPFILCSAALIALMFPEQAREARTYRQCVSIAFNLMSVSALARSVAFAPLRFAYPPAAPPPPGPPPQAPRGSEVGELPPTGPPPVGPAPGRKGCSVCCVDADCCDCCDAGECCCDAGDCCNCCDCS